WLGLPVERMGAEVLAAARRQSSRGPGRAQPEPHAVTNRERVAGGQPPGNGGESAARPELPRPALPDPPLAPEPQPPQAGRAQPEPHAVTNRERVAGGQPPGNGGESAARPELPRPDLRDPLVAAERQLLQVVLQYPGSLDEGSLEVLPADALRAPAHQVVFEGVRAGGGLATARTVSTQAWAATVSEATRTDARGLVHERAVAPLPVTLEPSSGLPPRR